MRRRRRKAGKRRYRKRLDLICEGGKTEPGYFNWIKTIIKKDKIHIDIKYRRSGYSPEELVKVATGLENGQYRQGDEIWIIMDVDNWTDTQFNKVEAWRRQNKSHNVAVTNPKFEYWLLLHGEKDPGFLNSQKCSELFNKTMGKNKEVDTAKLSLEGVLLAADRARIKYQSGTTKIYNFIPANCGSSLYKLIDKIQDYFMEQH